MTLRELIRQPDNTGGVVRINLLMQKPTLQLQSLEPHHATLMMMVSGQLLELSFDSMESLLDFSEQLRCLILDSQKSLAECAHKTRSGVIR